MRFFLQPKILIVDDLGTSQPGGLVQMTAPNDALISLPKENKPGLVELLRSKFLRRQLNATNAEA